MEEERGRGREGGEEKDWQLRFISRLEGGDSPLIERLKRAVEAVSSEESALKASFALTASAATSSPLTSSTNPPPPRTWRDLPPDMLAERLSKGEVIGRDEWIPGVTEGKRKLNEGSLREHLAFGAQIHSEGNEMYSKGDYEMALTRYTQGVQLLNWVESEDPSSLHLVDDLLLVMRKNRAQCCLKLGKYQEAKQAASEALLQDPHDAKARFRRAQASFLLGEMVPAKNDYIYILKSEYATVEEAMEAREGLRDIRRVVSKWRSDVSTIMDKSTQQDTFSANRQSSTTPLDIPSSSSTPLPPPSSSVSLPFSISPPSPISPSSSDPNREPTHYPFTSSTPPPLSLEETRELLEEIYDVYTSQGAQKLLNVERREADFVEKRILIRTKKLLPTLLGPILDKWKFDGENFTEKKMAMERCVSHWRLRDEEVKSWTEDIYNNFLGEIIED